MSGWLAELKNISNSVWYSTRIWSMRSQLREVKKGMNAQYFSSNKNRIKAPKNKTLIHQASLYKKKLSW